MKPRCHKNHRDTSDDVPLKFTTAVRFGEWGGRQDAAARLTEPRDVVLVVNGEFVVEVAVGGGRTRGHGAV